MTFDRDDTSGLKLHVTLADTVPVGGKVTLVFDYGGPLSGRLNNPDQAVRMASIGKDGGYLLLPARWFPLTDFPSNRYTGIFQIEVPGNNDRGWHRHFGRRPAVGHAKVRGRLASTRTRQHPG